MPRDKTSLGTDKLVANLSVEDARHLLKGEGGELTVTDIVLQAGSALVVAALTARAIVVGDATVWHLVMPMVAQYLVLIVAIPFAQVLVRHPGLHKDAMQSLRLWVVFAIILAGIVYSRSHELGTPWQDQLRADATRCWQWIVDAEMHWPILVAAASIAATVPGRVHNLFLHGPPFVGVSLGCAMRFVVMMLCCFLAPFVAANPGSIVWILWAIMLVAEPLALWMHWDVQTRLRKYDAAHGGPPRTNANEDS
jgi:hypothetical protein